MKKREDLTNIYVIGDVHGCYHTLIKLVEKLPEDAELIFVGDLCDRGLYTKEVLEFIISKGCKAIRGNHDYYMMAHIEECQAGEKVRWNTKKYMGGVETLQSYEKDSTLLQKHLGWLNTLPHYILLGNYFITHGFCLPYFKRRDDEEKTHAMMVNRVSDEKEWQWDWEEDWREYEIINIFGHDHADEIQKAKNYYGIDTGCVYGGKLTALQLGTMKVFEQELDGKDISASNSL